MCQLVGQIFIWDHWVWGWGNQAEALGIFLLLEEIDEGKHISVKHYSFHRGRQSASSCV